MNPRVSIIIPIYNGSLHIQETVESALNQSFLNFEIILINDYSNDNSEDIISQFFSDPKIFYIKNDKNLNIVGSRNKGLAIAKGEYICFLDQDDLFLSTKIEQQLQFLDRNPDYGLVGCHTVFIDQEGAEVKRQKSRLSDKNIRKNILLSNQFACGSVMFRRNLVNKIGGLSEKYIRCDDYELRLKIGKVSKMANIDEYLFKYRIHNNNTTNQGNNLRDMKTKTLKIVYKHGKHYPHYYLALVVNVLNIVLPGSIFIFFVKLYKKWSK